MTSPLLYSANPWFAHQIAKDYRAGKHFAWVSEYYDPHAQGVHTGAHHIAPSSAPKIIYDSLWNDFHFEDTHSVRIDGYKKTFRRLAATWLSSGEITRAQHDEIKEVVNSSSWRIWRPVLYVIPRAGIDDARIVRVPRRGRAGYGPELQIPDLSTSEFDILEVR